MRKAVLVFAFAALAMGCEKVPKGGNKGVLKMEEGVERYDSHETRTAETHTATDTAAAHPDVLKTDSAATQPATAAPVSDSTATR